MTPCIYRRMDISTISPTPPQEKAGVPHHMIDVANPGEFSAERYRLRRCRWWIDILAGASRWWWWSAGLYLDALLNGHVRRQRTGWQKKLRTSLTPGASRALWEALQRRSTRRPPSAPPPGHRRVIRALEVYYETGTCISAHNAATGCCPRYTALKFGLN